MSRKQTVVFGTESLMQIPMRQLFSLFLAEFRSGQVDHRRLEITGLTAGLHSCRLSVVEKTNTKLFGRSWVF